MARNKFHWTSDKTDAIAFACENGLEYHWLESKRMWLVCSEDDWRAVLRGDIIIC